MGLFDLVRSLVSRAEGGEPAVPRLGSVARSYVETGDPPDDSWRAHEGPNGELHVVVTVAGAEGGPPAEADVEAVGREVRSLGGSVQRRGDGGIMLVDVGKDRLRELADYDRIRQLEVTREPDG